MESKLLNYFNIGKIISAIPTKFKIEPFKYCTIKIIPFKSGYSSDEFEKVMNTLNKYNKSLLDRFELDKENRTLRYRPLQALCYEVLMTKDKISYNYAIPSVYKTVFLNKIKFLLHDCDVIEVSDYISDFNNSVKVSYGYKNSWILSLNTYKDINITDSLMILHSDLKATDSKVLLQYLFKPLQDFDWKGKWENSYNAYNSTGTLNTSMGILDILDRLNDKFLTQFDYFVNALSEAIGGEAPIENENKNMNYAKDLTTETKHKTMYDGFRTGINLYIKTQNQVVVDNISRNTSTILQDLNGDNALTIVSSKVIVKAERKITKGFTANSLECRQLIKMPSADTLLKYEDLLDKINVAELDTPKDLLKDNGIQLGEIMLGSTYRKITFGTHANSLSKPLFYLGEMEAGKSSFSRMYAIGALEQGHSAFIFDTIDGKNITHVRDYLPENFPEEKIIILDFKDDEYAFPLLWNEISDFYKEKLNAAVDNIDRYRIMEEFAGIISTELERFIDTLQTDHKEQQLTTGMRDILNKLAQLVFMNDGTVTQISDCLWNAELRHTLLRNLNIPNHLPFAKAILDLDNEESTITLRGIETRLNLITKNNTLKKYFSINPKDKKLDFTKWANNGYAVLIRVPETIANVVVTFLTQKLWLATITSRYDMEEDDRPHTHLLIDEPNRYPSIMDLLKDHFIASRKWHLRFLFFIHNMEIFKSSLENLRSAGVSIIMTPTNEKNFNMCAAFFKPYEYEAMEEVKKLIAKCNGKYRYALCSIHYKNVNYPMIIKLPLPVEKRYKKIDRKHLNKKCAEEFGISQREYYEELFKENVPEKVEDENIDKEEIAI